ncbi:Dihydroxyacetone kinase, putative [Perkinsus marinus ATCC 50983]|uniref:Dihydroxyacetone kinase, putative n=1 Tax=Perkinsus marinus (strain ATCC 50983 / TXsc) TaxID=423536 RepID=C5LE89_PERM5|nr:Dihydroxyacetone kinase, putative [Perkinsus marinus ATCC 50983]EER04957.1 Dihydroxyacetone kinase, putative [Perkinsus marinus ATCC 50983]|eukprot:XP_002773141.1 Dihydroxyacetone kinase, putative [Perkinsus marinus ATCC 50983]
MSHCFLNSKKKFVSDALGGLVTTSAGSIARLVTTDEDTQVIVRADWSKERVAVISGGGSGHEPTHPGFVGRGMLTAAVCGSVFASPSVSAILSTIVHVTGPAGCLLVVKNYTGDRLNFGLAREVAKSKFNLKVEMVIVSDDIAIPGSAQPRGIAGTLLVHKIAGAKADTGANLEDVLKVAHAAAEGVMSIGVALTDCHMPGEDTRVSRVAPGTMEVGLGIHGEPGAATVPIQTADDTVEALVGKLREAAKKRGRELGRTALLVNNLGTCMPSEMEIIANHAVSSVKPSLVVGPAALMTSLDMHGFSLTILPLTDELEQLLRAPTAVSSWPTAKVPSPALSIFAPEIATESAKFVPSLNPLYRSRLEAACHAVISSENELNNLDSAVGDGDCGSTLAAGARAVLSSSDEAPYGDGKDLALWLAEASDRIGGSSGVLAAIFFTGVAKTGDWSAAAIKAGVDSMTFYGGASVGSRTAMDALIPFADALLSGKSIEEAAERAREGAESTAKMASASHGRSANVPTEALMGRVDPGAVAVARVVKAIADVDE